MPRPAPRVVQAAAASSSHELREAYRAFVDFHGELLLLLNWSSMAYTALVKVGGNIVGTAHAPPPRLPAQMPA